MNKNNFRKCMMEYVTYRLRKNDHIWTNGEMKYSYFPPIFDNILRSEELNYRWKQQKDLLTPLFNGGDGASYILFEMQMDELMQKWNIKKPSTVVGYMALIGVVCLLARDMGHEDLVDFIIGWSIDYYLMREERMPADLASGAM
jgi:hypothetical protein